MSKISDYINILKERRNELEKIKKEQDIKRMNNDPVQFYLDTMKISKINDGMVILITPDNEYREYAPNGMSHRKVCQELLDNISDTHIDLAEVDGDFGDIIPKEFNTIFIRMASLLNGSTVVYYPEKCTEYQIGKLEEFNDSIKKFNSTREDDLKVSFEYNGKDDQEKNNLDDVIAQLKCNYTK